MSIDRKTALEINQEGNFIRWDDRSLEIVTQSYPEALREPVLWLGWFGREECNKDVDTLYERAKELGIQHDKTNWSKILRGRWNKDREGNALPSPIIALDKVLKAIQTLREDHRVREMAGKVPFILTPTAQDIFNFIDVRRSIERVNRFGVVVGYTGSQKTATFKEYCRQNNHGLCVWMEAPESGSMAEFTTFLSVKYGGTAGDNLKKHRERIFKTVNDRRTIIIDNAQAMYRPAADTQQPIFNFLRRLQDEKRCTVILSITPEFNVRLRDKMLQGYFEQFEGRAGGRRNFLILPDYPPEDDVLMIAKAFGLRDAEKHIDYLVRIAKDAGRVRLLFQDLQDGKQIAEQEKRPFTIGHVKEARGED